MKIQANDTVKVVQKTLVNFKILEDYVKEMT